MTNTPDNDAMRALERLRHTISMYDGIDDDYITIHTALQRSGILEKALDAATETFKEEHQRWATEKRSLERRLKEARSAQVDGLMKALKYQEHTQRAQAELLEQRNFRGQCNADTVAFNLKLNAAHAAKAIAEYTINEEKND